MLGTLRENPALEKKWSSPSVLEAAVTAGRRATGAAREVSALSATLDSLLDSNAAEQNEALARNLRRIGQSTEAMLSSFRSIAGRLEDLRSVVHGEGGGGGGHSHS
ncbi:MAG: hypothetical protein ABEJ46_00165, partial [Gemmatimonadota bacterium]